MHEILIADDHPLFLDAITTVLVNNFPGSVVHQAENFEEACKKADQNSELSLILLDLNMPGMDGLNGIIKLRNRFPEIPVVIVSAEKEKNMVLQSITYGAVGFITKSMRSDQMAEALQQILAGEVYLPPDIIRSSSQTSTEKSSRGQDVDPKLLSTLTRRQLLVFEKMASGGSNKQIAYELNIAETTVKAHVSAILRKLKVHNRIQAVLCAASIDFNQYLHR